MAQAERPFRIIVVGGGVAGLVASNALQKLGIDHVVLEKHSDIAPPLGAGISMWPHGLRILHQLGYLPAIQKAAVPISREVSVDDFPSYQLALFIPVVKDHHESHKLSNNASHGIGFFPLERRNFLEILYDGLPDKSFIKTNAGVEDVRQFPDRVEVKLGDGTVEVGDMVLGCDGVHSHMRTLMWQHAGKTSPGLIPNKEKTSLKTSWKTLALTTPPIPELGDSYLTVTYNRGITFLATSQPHAVYFFVIFALDEPFTWPHRERYTEEDAQKLADLVIDKPITQELLFGEVWRRRTRSAVISLEECVMDHWHHGRIVLAGDAVHKVHPNMALGGNSAIEGVARVINNIHKVMQATKGPKPSGTALNSAFATYQQEMQQRMKELMDISNMVAKMHTYATPYHKFLANWILPLSNDRNFADLIGGYIAAGPKLSFLPSAGFTTGMMEWQEKSDDVDDNENNPKAIEITKMTMARISEISATA
ncbi:fad binding domain-containing [Trichoderma cornu-damae]|uniref:Fad binding domain-containing n=1 Tax=Trichoderma cornu-damae TaxID=654480 RepID=A0A9P8TT83_9HYPO|nr:fad binding domain-containing [Trichoderma cornu-damae]